MAGNGYRSADTRVDGPSITLTAERRPLRPNFRRLLNHFQRERTSSTIIETRTNASAAISSGPPSRISPEHLFSQKKTIPYLRRGTRPVYVFLHADGQITNAHQERFTDLKDILQRHIEKYSKLRDCLANISYELRVCGTDESSASPAILIFCPLNKAKYLRTVINQPHVQDQCKIRRNLLADQYPEVQVIIWANDINRLTPSTAPSTLRTSSSIFRTVSSAPGTFTSKVSSAFESPATLHSSQHTISQDLTYSDPIPRPGATCSVAVQGRQSALATAHALRNPPATSTGTHQQDIATKAPSRQLSSSSKAPVIGESEIASVSASNSVVQHDEANRGPETLSVHSQSPLNPVESTRKSTVSREDCHSKLNAAGKSSEYLPNNSLGGTSSPLWTAENNTKTWVEELKVSGAPNGRDQCTTRPSEDSPYSTCLESGSSPAEDHSSATDSDLLSISDTSDPGICFDIGPPSQLQRHLLNYILEDYREATRYHSGDSSCAAPGPNASKIPTGSLSQTSSEKRKFNEQGSPVESDDGPSTKMAKRAQQCGIYSKVFACPFWKNDSVLHRICCKLTLRRIRDVKQHLHRRHTPEMVCSRCLEVFDDSDRYDAHSQSPVPCFRAPNSRLDGITQRQSKAISKKSKRNQSDEEQWFAVWDIIFPNTPRPASAYLNSELSEDLNSFQEYWTNRGHDVLLRELNRSDVWTLSPDEREAQARQILGRGLNSIYEQWAGLRRNAATIDTTPFLGIAISPSLTNASAMQSSTAASSGSSIPSASQVVQATMTPPNEAVVDNSATANSQVEGVDLQHVQSHTNSYALPIEAIITWPPQTGETVGTQSNVEEGDLEFVLDGVLDPPFTLDSAFDFEVG